MINQNSRKGNSKLELLNDYCVIDIETTGLDATADEIIEISALKIKNNSIIAKFSNLVKPQREISEFIANLTGITNDLVENEKSIEEILPDFREFIGSSILVGHNLRFDINFLSCLFVKYFDYDFANAYVDTMRLSRFLYKELDNYKLTTLANFLGIKTDGMHRATKDCFVTMQCYEKMKEYILFNRIDLNELMKRKKSSLHAKDIIVCNDQIDVDNLFYGQECVFTGTLAMPRRKAMQMVVDVGGKCADNITQKTRYLIVGNLEYQANIKGGKSTKLKKAESLILKGFDIEIISENVFYNVFDIKKEKNISDTVTTEVKNDHIKIERNFVEGTDYCLDEDKAYYYLNKGKNCEFENKLFEAIEAYEQAAYYGFTGNYVYDRLCVLYKKTNQPKKIKNILEFAIFIFDKIVPYTRCDRESKLNKYLDKLKKLK